MRLIQKFFDMIPQTEIVVQEKQVRTVILKRKEKLGQSDSLYRIILQNKEKEVKEEVIKGS